MVRNDDSGNTASPSSGVTSLVDENAQLKARVNFLENELNEARQSKVDELTQVKAQLVELERELAEGRQTNVDTKTIDYEDEIVQVKAQLVESQEVFVY